MATLFGAVVQFLPTSFLLSTPTQGVLASSRQYWEELGFINGSAIIQVWQYRVVAVRKPRI